MLQIDKIKSGTQREWMLITTKSRLSTKLTISYEKEQTSSSRKKSRHQLVLDALKINFDTIKASPIPFINVIQTIACGMLLMSEYFIFDFSSKRTLLPITVV